MSIEEIPSDELIEMTDLFHRAFNAAGCNPACHCCYKFIAAGEKFKLATVRKVQAKFEYARVSSLSTTRLNVITGELGNDDYIVDESREVMLCENCTPDLFQEKQLSKAKEELESYEKYKSNSGGCFRINGKIVH